MIEMERRDIGDAPYASYLLGEVADIRKGFDGLQGALIEAGLGDRFVRLTDGREVGKLVEWMTFGYEPTAKSFTIVSKAAGRDEPTPGYAVAGILWLTKELRDLAKDADLVIDRGVLILRGDEGEPAAKWRFQPAKSVGRKVIAT
jgi:hypothetical protein